MRIPRNSNTWLVRLAALVALVFGVATIRAGGSVLFGDGAQAAGNVVGFVLWFNFLAGFAYIVAGVGLWLRRHWSAQLALAIAAGTVLVFVAFGIHVVLGGAFEARTAWAMTLRSVVWILIALLAFKAAKRDDRAPVIFGSGH
jgi:membrane-bound acyltransferase YfiQ involved in biofilm formation